MNWTRGLKFAGIHVAIAIPLIASEEIPRWETEKTHAQLSGRRILLAANQEEPSTVEFTPMCEAWRSISGAEKLLRVSETPALIFSGWNSDCPASWTISGLIGIDIRHHSLEQRLTSDFGLCMLIAIQWILLGGLPLVKPRRWWLEPGAGNTVLTVAGVPIVLVFAGLASSDVPKMDGIAVVFGLVLLLALLIIFSTWLAWLGLIAQRLLRFGWQLAAAASRSTRAR